MKDFAPEFRERAKRNERKYSGYWLFACGVVYGLWLVMMFEGAVAL